MTRSSNPDSFLSQQESDMIRQAIIEAEQNTSAEIKLVIVRHCWDDARKKAIRLFHKLNLDRTEDRNCVLIMLVLTNREFVVYGDIGIHKKAGVDLWIEAKDAMAAGFANDQFGQGLSDGIRIIGERLKQFFPYKSSDKDEISNEIEYED